MKNNNILFIVFALIMSQIIAQTKINEHTFTVNELTSEKLQSFIKEKIKPSQFIMLGEQHGIKEVGEITNTLYNLSRPFGYNTLCIETSPFAANILDLQFTGSKNPEVGLQKLYAAYPYAIPFYNNKNDIDLFKNVVNNKGNIWGIDQTFMIEFRLVFHYILNNSSNQKLKKAVKPLLEEAIKGFDIATEEKNFMAPFIFKYSDELHQSLLNLTSTEEEINVLEDLKKTKEIYLHYFQKRHYLNNNVRAKLMKTNFLNYYKEASKDGKLPKVVFKLGANHVGKGLNTTNVYDISNMISELAIINNKTSVHIYASGVNGMQNIGNPFSSVSVVPFDYTNKLPEEVAEAVKIQEEKYLIIDAEALRIKANSLSDKLKKLVLKYDVLIYIKDCKALEDFD